MTFPGQPRSASSGFTGDRVASCPASAILQHYLLRLTECPQPCSACRADDVSPSIPGHRILRLLPAIRPRVSPKLVSFSVSGCSAPGVPETQAPPASLPMSPRASPGTASSGCTDGERPGRPAPSCPPAMPIGGSPGSPGSRAFRPFRIRFPGSPRLCGYGWVNDVSPPSLEPCILGLSRARTLRVSPLHAPAGCAADESSCSIGSCNPCLALQCTLNLGRSSTCGKPPVFSRFPLVPHLRALPELQSKLKNAFNLEGKWYFPNQRLS